MRRVLREALAKDKDEWVEAMAKIAALDRETFERLRGRARRLAALDECSDNRN